MRARFAPKLPFVTGTRAPLVSLYTVGTLIAAPGVFTTKGVFLARVVQVQYTDGVTRRWLLVPTVVLRVVNALRTLTLIGMQTLADVVYVIMT